MDQNCLIYAYNELYSLNICILSTLSFNDAHELLRVVKKNPSFSFNYTCGYIPIILLCFVAQTGITSFGNVKSWPVLKKIAK
jgi:hypothetical protein